MVVTKKKILLTVIFTLLYAESLFLTAPLFANELNGHDTDIPAEAQGRDDDVSQSKIQSGQAFPPVNQTPAGRLPP
jgi:hypothetical protein